MAVKEGKSNIWATCTCSLDLLVHVFQVVQLEGRNDGWLLRVLHQGILRAIYLHTKPNIPHLPSLGCQLQELVRVDLRKQESVENKVVKI